MTAWNAAAHALVRLRACTATLSSFIIPLLLVRFETCSAGAAQHNDTMQLLHCKAAATLTPAPAAPSACGSPSLFSQPGGEGGGGEWDARTQGVGRGRG